MDKVFNSSKNLLFKNFLGDLVWAAPAVLLIVIFVWNTVKDGGISELPPDSVQILFLVLAIASAYILIVALLALYFSFIRLNITAEITPEGIKLLRGKKVYKSLSSKDYAFSSLIVKQQYIITYTKRYLRVFGNNYTAPGEKDATRNSSKGAFSMFKTNYKDYRLCFSKDDFEDFISAATAITQSQEQET